MASENPEDGFAQHGEETDNAWGTGDGVGTSEDQHTEHDSHEQAQEPISADPSSNASGDPTSDADEDGGEYDPESISITTTTIPVLPPASHTPVAAAERDEATASPRPSKKPKKAGGFIVGSSDDEDDSATPPPAVAPTAANSLKPASSDSQPRAFTHSPLQQSTTTAEAITDPAAAGPTAQVSNGLGIVTTTQNINEAKSRLPTDAIGILEDRIKDDPRGDMEAWLSLIDEYRRRNVIQDIRAVYERFLKVFPQSAEMWVQYLQQELSLDNFAEAEQIFQRTLMTIPSVQLWTAYLDYIRRRNDLHDGTGQARQIVNQSYEFVLDNIGHDRDSGKMWHDYIQFIKSGPGQIDGKGWQDMQKMDVLRKAYQRAICIPMSNLNILWKEYDQFELGINKVAGRKFLQEKSPSYMSARSANTHLENFTREPLSPDCPPTLGFEGDQEYLEQVDLWKRWIAWEKDDPLALKTDEPETYKSRVIHVYKQALMALRFWPELWVDAAEWCFDNGVLGKDGSDLGLQFLVDGITANPESTLLALKHADRIESTHPSGEGEAGKLALSQAVRAPFDTVLGALYDMVKKLKDREATAVGYIENDPSLADSDEPQMETDDGELAEQPAKTSLKEERIKAVREGFVVQIQMLSQQISYLWIALTRAFRRIQGQGKGTPTSGVRAIFTEARAKGRLTSDVYVAVAHIEWDIYQDPVATKIFERGAKLFPEDEHFMVAYLKHLHSRHDTTNARVVFSQSVKRFKEKPELTPKLKPLYAYFHSYEAKFGELAQIKELEKQMAESFPEDPSLAHFAARFSSERFNPISAPVIISPSTQMKPKGISIMPSVEQVNTSARVSPHPSVMADRSPRQQFMPVVNSPKRPYQPDEDDYPPRKVQRGASPLKGAAGRRMDQQRRAQGQGVTYSSTPAPISRDITFLLSLIPPSHQCDAQRFRSDAMVRVIRDTTVPDYNEWRASQNQGMRSDQASRPSGRPDSPYARGLTRLPPQPTAQYTQRPPSSDDYEPSPSDWTQPPQAANFGQQGFTPSQLANPYMVPGASASLPGYPAQPNQYYGAQY
ncbi:mRNA 3'-end-processing protein RNA14 [Apiospora rasikravindrae]|uniref:mRNA 3'-end-processing protein RNA14 n=1 Tax=Apiospora rasikravindrae TaxID=990691 RepID=A0ABR1RRE6_9PEZI